MSNHPTGKTPSVIKNSADTRQADGSHGIKDPKRFAVSFFLVPAFVSFDLITKNIAMRVLHGSPKELIPGVFSLMYLENRGAAFGILTGKTVWLSIFSFICILLIFTALLKIPADRHYRPLRLVLAVLAAGAAGNLADRIRYHYVRDFLYFELIDFPVFNVADIYVTCSIIILILLICFYYKEEDLSFFGVKRYGDE